MQSKIDWTKYGRSPTFSIQNLMSQKQLNPTTLQTDIEYVRLNKASSYEDWTAAAPASLYTFYDFFFVRMLNAKIDDNPDTYSPATRMSMVQTIVMVDNTYLTNARRVYTLIDLISELGGVQGLLVELAGVFLLPISRYQVFLKAVS